MANSDKTLWERLSFPQSYTSLVLGIVVVVVVAILVIGLIRRGTGLIPTISPPAETPESQFTQEGKVLPTAYTVVEGDNLWSISEKFYKSGYNWVDVVKENKLANPELVFVGATLTIPKVEPRVTTVASVSDKVDAITGDKYTVVKDDNLWNIAVRAYGDGFKWVDLAKVNNLANPDLIHAGNELKIPR